MIFFSWCTAPRCLHSFPTRRSSDLIGGILEPESIGNDARRPSRPGSCLSRAGCRTRSEEHTSELQSHVKLVCRLLLEKKKYVRPSCSYSTKYLVHLPRTKCSLTPSF